MNKLIKKTLPIVLFGATVTSIVVPLTSCQSLFVILKSVVYEPDAFLEPQDAPTNSQVVDATNTQFILIDYTWTWSNLPDGITKPLPLKDLQGYESHLLLYASDIEYSVKVTASLEYNHDVFKHSITVKVPKTTDSV